MKRTPEGKFISRENMLSAWLPTLLSWCWTGALDASLWFQRRAILLDTKIRLAEIK